jgi:hypothetical protein
MTYLISYTLSESFQKSWKTAWAALIAPTALIFYLIVTYS